MSPPFSVSLFTVVCACVELCTCFPNGSVLISCDHMRPSHPPYEPSTSRSPFSVSTSSATYKPGGVITVTVEVEKSSAAEFQGFLLQARSRDQNAQLWPLGKFTNTDPTVFTSLSCNKMENSAVSQASSAKRRTINVTWEAPDTDEYPDIYFSATVVQDYTAFWVQLNSSSLRLDTGGNSAAGVVNPSVLLFIVLMSLSVFG